MRHSQRIRRVLIVQALVLQTGVNGTQSVAEESYSKNENERENTTGDWSHRRPFACDHLLRGLRIYAQRCSSYIFLFIL